MKDISAKEVKERQDAGEQLNLLDVREPDECAAFNIGGIQIPLGKVRAREVEKIEDLKEEELICYCRSGGRSAMAGLVLEQLGFKNIKNMVGGVIAYQKLSKVAPK